MTAASPDADPVAAMDSLLDRLVSVLSGSATGGGRSSTGTAEDEGVVVTVGPDGRVLEIRIDPLMRRRPESIAPGIVAAANEAIAARPEGGASHGTLTEQLKAIQEDSLVVTRQLNASLIASLEHLKGS